MAAARVGFSLPGATLLFGYGFCLNLAPVEFGRVVGLYIATLFIVWQITNFVMFSQFARNAGFVWRLHFIAGGLVVTFWK